MSHSEPLSRATLFAYAAPALPLAMLALPFYVLVPGFYAETLGLNIALVGSVLFGVRVLDALSDPAVGIFADRIQPRAMGRAFRINKRTSHITVIVKQREEA